MIIKGVGTQIRMASTSDKRAGSVVASKRPALTCSAIVSDGKCLRYVLLALIESTFVDQDRIQEPKHLDLAN